MSASAQDLRRELDALERTRGRCPRVQALVRDLDAEAARTPWSDAFRRCQLEDAARLMEFRLNRGEEIGEQNDAELRQYLALTKEGEFDDRG